MSELPRGWAQTSLRAIIELKYGKSLPKGDRKEGPYNVYGSNGIVGTNQSSLSSAPAIIVGRKGSFGEVNYSAEKCFPIDTTYYVDEFDVVEPNFCYSLLKHLPLKSLNRATAIPGLNREDAYGLTFALPPLAEQKRIVAKLNALNAKSARVRTELARVETLVSRYKQAVLSKAFSGELTRQWRDIQAKATGWPNAVISDIAEVVTGSTPKTAEKARFFDGDTPFFKPTDLDQGYHVQTPRETLSAAGVAVSRLVPDRSVLVTCIGATIGKVGFARVACCTNQQINALVPNITVARPEWLYWVISSPDFQALILANSSATTLPIINKGRFQQLPLGLPPVEEQHEIVRRIESTFAKIDRLAKEAKRALELVGRLDEAILAKAFRGELVPQEENDEPAEKLLERIREERQAAPKVKKKIAKRTSAMLTARDFLNAKLPNWPHEGISFQELRSEFSGSYDDLKDALFAMLSNENAPLRQVFDEQQSSMTLRRR